MDCDGCSENKCFTFTWNIENFSYSCQKNGEFISSPVFIVDAMGKTKWSLRLYPKGENDEEMKSFISFYLIRECCSKGRNNLDINFDLSFLAADGSVLVSDSFGKYSFGEGWGTNEFVKLDEVLKIRRKDYLPGNILTARCRMWNDKAINWGHCLAHTRIAVERRSFLWNIKQFSCFQESIYKIPTTSTDKSMMTLKLFPSSGQNCKTFILEICARDQILKNSTFHLHLVDSAGNRTECLNDEIAFGKDIKTTLLMLTFSKEELMKNKNRYIPNDVLQLHCKCDIATGIVLEEIKNITFENPLSIQEGNLSYELESKDMLLESTRILKENLEFLYKENMLCDTKLKTKTGSLPAHKCILSARSAVFKAMFNNDMREKNSECVNIEDLDGDTVQRMLLYIYTATLQDLQWDSACNLYTAADKYEILSLKSECSSFLKNNLSQDNACDLLILADMHQDENLKSAVQDYILNHRVIFNTATWKHFMKVNAQLAAELLYLLVKE